MNGYNIALLRLILCLNMLPESERVCPGICRLNDLGRDILAFKTDKDGNNLVYIIQCKNWSSNKMIHENIVCQIFGSAVEYKIKHKDDMFLKVIPVICSTAPLSEMAKEFANINDCCTHS